MTPAEKSVTKICEEARRRLGELAPALEEAKRLKTVLAVLESDEQASDDERAAGLAALGGDPTRPTDTHVRADKDAIVAIVAKNPGITAAQIARDSGMKRTVVAATMSRLKRNGELVPDGDGARVPERRPSRKAAKSSAGRRAAATA